MCKHGLAGFDRKAGADVLAGSDHVFRWFEGFLLPAKHPILPSTEHHLNVKLGCLNQGVHAWSSPRCFHRPSINTECVLHKSVSMLGSDCCSLIVSHTRKCSAQVSKAETIAAIAGRALDIIAAYEAGVSRDGVAGQDTQTQSLLERLSSGAGMSS